MEACGMINDITQAPHAEQAQIAEKIIAHL